VKDSTIYKKILREGFFEVYALAYALGYAEGRIIEARRILLRLGTKRFGAPKAAVLAAIEDLHDINRLEDLIDRCFDADVLDWDGLLRLAS
jgi:hypothetical protein